MTITFTPANFTIDLKDGLTNHFLADGAEMKDKKVEEMSGNKYLYNHLHSVVDDKITLTSQTYCNSDYTVFIRMGYTGGKSSGTDAIDVYGQ